jgi:predicted DsbA family dithiol-disulfide isomerase
LALTLHWFAEEKGRGRAYRDAAHRAFFVEGLNLADERALREAAQEASLGANEAIVAAWVLRGSRIYELCVKKPRASG